ncbi:MAG: hypothetical protein ACYS67_09370 [Planctomycetota bacterium]|jgi:hypothetical protein
MKLPGCSIWFLVARTDVPFMMQTIPHIIKMCNYPFAQKVVAVDTSPLSGDYISRPCIGTLKELQKSCDELLISGVIDRVINIDFSEHYQERVYVKHLGKFIEQTHNYRGAPFLGYIFLLEKAQCDYLVHFNTDMLIYQEPDYNWISEGIKAMRQHPEIVCVTPLSGPPTEDGLLHQNVPYERDPRGFYRFKQFTSRKFLVDIKRFEKLLPLNILWKAETGRKLDKWEILVSDRLKETPFFRVDLDTPSAWALHSSYTHDQTFVQNLPKITEKIESGWYPSIQAGHYNLHLRSWLEVME